MFKMTKLKPYFKVCSNMECINAGAGFTTSVSGGNTIISQNIFVGGTANMQLGDISVFMRVHLSLNGQDIHFAGFSDAGLDIPTITALEAASGNTYSGNNLGDALHNFSIANANFVGLKIKIKIKLVKKSRFFSHFIYYDPQ